MYKVAATEVIMYTRYNHAIAMPGTIPTETNAARGTTIYHSKQSAYIAVKQIIPRRDVNDRIKTCFNGKEQEHFQYVCTRPWQQQQYRGSRNVNSVQEAYYNDAEQPTINKENIARQYFNNSNYNGEPQVQHSYFIYMKKSICRRYKRTPKHVWQQGCGNTGTAVRYYA